MDKAQAQVQADPKDAPTVATAKWEAQMNAALGAQSAAMALLRPFLATPITKPLAQPSPYLATFSGNGRAARRRSLERPTGPRVGDGLQAEPRSQRTSSNVIVDHDRREALAICCQCPSEAGAPRAAATRPAQSLSAQVHAIAVGESKRSSEMGAGGARQPGR